MADRGTPRQTLRARILKIGTRRPLAAVVWQPGVWHFESARADSPALADTSAEKVPALARPPGTALREYTRAAALTQAVQLELEPIRIAQLDEVAEPRKGLHARVLDADGA